MALQKLNNLFSWTTKMNPGDITLPDYNTLYIIKYM
jgi:hypothetical protein